MKAPLRRLQTLPWRTGQRKDPAVVDADAAGLLLLLHPEGSTSTSAAEDGAFVVPTGGGTATVGSTSTLHGPTSSARTSAGQQQGHGHEQHPASGIGFSQAQAQHAHHLPSTTQVQPGGTAQLQLGSAGASHGARTTGGGARGAVEAFVDANTSPVRLVLPRLRLVGNTNSAEAAVPAAAPSPTTTSSQQQQQQPAAQATSYQQQHQQQHQAEHTANASSSGNNNPFSQLQLGFDGGTVAMGDVYFLRNTLDWLFSNLGPGDSTSVLTPTATSGAVGFHVSQAQPAAAATVTSISQQQPTATSASSAAPAASGPPGAAISTAGICSSSNSSSGTGNA